MYNHQGLNLRLRSLLGRAVSSGTKSVAIRPADLLGRCVDSLSKQSPINGLFSGVMLTSQVGAKAIGALQQPDKVSIAGVPVDARSYCRRLLRDSIKRPGLVGRRDLLCSTAFPGSGKSVVLWFNCFWFVKETKGIAVEVTFNCDQGTLFNDGVAVTSPKVLKQALAVRIVHRLLTTLGCDQDEADLACCPGGEVVRVVEQLQQPLDTAINVLRTKLGAQSDTKVLLCVDELAKATGSPSFTAENALKVLTARLDRDETFFLAISALGAHDVIKLATDSNRHLLLQALGPLWFANGLHPDSRRLLPDALRPFYDEEIRKQLPWDPDAKELYYDLTKLLATAAGHPRRLEVLFRELRRFVPSKQAAMVLAGGSDRTPGQAFVKELAAWLQAPVYDDLPAPWTQLEDIISAVKKVVKLPTDYGELVPESDRQTPTAVKVSAIEALAVRSAAPFDLPRDADAKRRLKTVLHGVGKGFCQLVEVLPPGMLFQAFIPLPVLNPATCPKPLQPCGEALFDLHDAVRDLYKPCKPGEEGKAFERATVASMLLLARARVLFKLSDLCVKGDAGAELADLVLMGGPGVFVSRASCWPADQEQGITSMDVQVAVDKLLDSGAPGMLITVTNKYNIPADFYGLFKTAYGDKPFVLLRVQCKDWFLDAVYNKARGCKEDIVKKWRQHDKLAPPSVEVVVDGTTHTVPCVSLLFTANRLEQPVQLGPLEGIITTASMRHWLPTAAHALQTVTHLRELFGWRNGEDAGASDA